MVREKLFVGRTKADAPEVDGVVYVTGKGLEPGGLYGVRITDTLEYDLVGQACSGARRAMAERVFA